jgi:hypothetical protein
MPNPDPFTIASLDAIPYEKPIDLKALSNVERAQAIEDLTNIKSIVFFHDGISVAFLNHLIASLQYYQLQSQS